MASPAALLALAGAALLLGARRSGHKHKLMSFDIDLARRPYTEIEIFNLQASLADAAEATGDGAMPFYDGFPEGIIEENGYDPSVTKAINIWVSENGKTYPDPRRFVQWNIVVAGNMTKQEFWDTYCFAVSENNVLNFYVLGAETTRNRCCQEIRCWKKSSDMVDGKLVVTEEEIRTDHGGHPPDMQKKLGKGWECHCYKAASACYSIVERPPYNWPTIITSKLEQIQQTLRS